jgi:hypothetical protein
MPSLDFRDVPLVKFAWIDRPGAILNASAEFRILRDRGEPISLAVACGWTIGYAGSPLLGRYSNHSSIPGRKWERFKKDVERDVSRVDEINRFLAKEQRS